MTTAYQLDRKLEELEAARRRLHLRFGDPPKSTSTQRKAPTGQRETASTQQQRDMGSMKVLRQALKNEDLSPYARATMTKSLRRIVRSLEGKTAPTGQEMSEQATLAKRHQSAAKQQQPAPKQYQPASKRHQPAQKQRQNASEVLSRQDELVNQTLLHEAAHAVIGYRLGSKIQEITITGEREGEVSHYPADARSMAVMSLAGAAAEEEANTKSEADRYHAFFAGLRTSPHAASPPFPSDNDLAHVRQYVQQTNDAWQLRENRLESTTVYRALRAEARELVRANWAAICDLAIDLNERLGDGLTCSMKAAEFNSFMRGK